MNNELINRLAKVGISLHHVPIDILLSDSQNSSPDMTLAEIDGLDKRIYIKKYNQYYHLVKVSYRPVSKIIDDNLLIQEL